MASTLPAIAGEPAATITNAYDDAGNLKSTTDAKSNVTSHTYNALTNHLASTIPALSAGNNVITSAYDTRDWATGSSNSLGHTAITEYAAAHRPTAIIDPLIRRTESFYNKNGQITDIKDPLNRFTKSVWNERGEKERATDALNKHTDSIYNRIGNLTKLTNRRGKVYLFGYDNAKRPTSSTTPTGKNMVTAYFDNNQVRTIQEPSTQTTTLAYNGKNLVSSKTDPAGTISYGYDNRGLLTTVTEGTAVITRTYNARNLLATVTDWNTRVTTYQYDRLGRLIGITRPNGTTATLARDAADQLTSIRETTGGKLISYLRFDYDAASQIERRFRAPLVQSGWQHPTFTGTYDDDNRLATVNGQTATHDADGYKANGPIRQDSGHLDLTVHG